MKLLFCPDCKDVFKLVIHGERSCLCGKVKGKLTGVDRSAIVNGKGVSLILSDPTLDEGIKSLARMDQNQPQSYYRGNKSYYRGNTPVELYLCPHSGYGNPRTRVVENYPETSETETLSPDKMAYREKQVNKAPLRQRQELTDADI